MCGNATNARALLVSLLIRGHNTHKHARPHRTHEYYYILVYVCIIFERKKNA